MTSYLTDYVALNDLKDHLRVPHATVTDDAELGLVITAASRAVDQFTNRRFGLDPSAVARVYAWGGEMISGRQALDVRDFQTTVGLVAATDSGQFTYPNTVVNGTDFDLWPFNAAADGLPWTHLLFRGTASHNLTGTGSNVTVTARAGWTTIPSAVEIATLIQAARFFMRRDSWAGVAGSPELGSEIRLLNTLDPDVQASLAAYVRYWGGA